MYKFLPHRKRGGYSRALKKCLLMMKLVLFLLTAMFTQVSARSFGQTVTLQRDNVPLSQVIEDIRQQTGYDFFYDVQLISKARPVTIHLQEVQLEDALSLIFEDQPLTFVLTKTDKAVVLKDKAYRDNITTQLLAITVTGIVVDAGNNVPLKGATIRVKGTNQITNTNEEGRFILRNVEEKAMLVVSFLGYKTAEVKVSATPFTVPLMLNVSDLSGVTVSTGYWKTTRALNTGNIEKVTSKDIERQPVTNPLMALQGRVPGLDIMPGSGIPGSVASVTIRGLNSLRFIGNNPLYVVDGVPVDSKILSTQSEGFGMGVESQFIGFDPLNTLNPANIESIEILKDADATAIYGSRGANGVIRITTKKGQNLQRTSFQLDMSTGFGKVAYFPHLLNTEQYLEMRNEAYRNDNAPITGVAARDLLVWDTTRYTYWPKELLGGHASNSNIQANILWGNENTSFRFGGAWQRETTVYPGNFGLNKGTGNFTLHHQSFNKKLNLDLSINYGASKNKFYNSNSFTNIALTLAPNAPDLYTPDGAINWQTGNNGNGTMAALNKTSTVNTGSLNANTVFSWQFTPSFKLRTSLGYTDLNSDELNITPISSVPPEAAPFYTGSSVFVTNKRKTWFAEPQLEYTKNIDKHHFEALLGITFQRSTSVLQTVSASGYASDALLGSLRSAASIFYMNDDNTIYKYAAAYARIGYNYDGKYLLNVTGRRDGSSRFSPENQFGNFGAVGAGWIFSRENWISQHLPFLSFGKIRGSYGIVGNDQIPDYAYFDSYSTSSRFYQGGMTFWPVSLYNPNFSWESTVKSEAGLQLGFLQDRISVEVTHYLSRSSNQLINYALPATTGFDNFPAYNFPATIQNSGWEFSMNAGLVKRKDFSWNISANLTIPQNKLIAFPGLEDSYYSTVYKIGEPLNIRRMYTWLRVNPNTGLHEVLDVDNSGAIDFRDQTFRNVWRRKYYGGVNNTFSWKQFDLSFLFQFVKQDVQLTTLTIPGWLGNQFTDVMTRWQHPGDITHYQKFTTQIDGFITQADANYSDWASADGSFIRLKTLQLDWNMPEKIAGKLAMRQLKAFFQGQNLLTFTRFNKGYDPETITNLPPLQTFNFGLSANF